MSKALYLIIGICLFLLFLISQEEIIVRMRHLLYANLLFVLIIVIVSLAVGVKRWR